MMNKDNRPELKDLVSRPAWKRVLFSLAIGSIVLWVHLVDFWYYLNFNFLFARRAFVKRTTQHAHYIGSDIQKPHKLAAALLLGVLVGGVVAAPTVEDMMIWALIWGTVFSAIVNYRLIKRWLEIMSFIGPGRKKAT
jgi:hypothetical protein